METAALILLIVVSSVLAIFLIVCIVLAVIAVKLVRQLKLIADRAETAVDSVASAGVLLKNASGPLAVAKLATKMARKYYRNK